jgi:hypothetical protein
MNGRIYLIWVAPCLDWVVEGHANFSCGGMPWQNNERWRDTVNGGLAGRWGQTFERRAYRFCTHTPPCSDCNIPQVFWCSTGSRRLVLECQILHTLTHCMDLYPPFSYRLRDRFRHLWPPVGDSFTTSVKG